MDERLKWIESKISSSLKPKNEELKSMFSSDENRLAFHEFIKNEDCRHLYIYTLSSRKIIASLSPPHTVESKFVFFLKNQGTKLTKDNIGEEVTCTDCALELLNNLDLTAREVFLPLLCSNEESVNQFAVSSDRLMDQLHRITSIAEISNGYIKGETVLPLPSVEVLADAAANVNRRPAVLHVLETTVIGWMKQIRGLLKHEPDQDLTRLFGKYPSPLDELQLWQSRHRMLRFVEHQLSTAVAKDILVNLEEAQSQYANPFQQICKEITLALEETDEILQYWKAMKPWFDKFHQTLNPSEQLKLLPPIVHTVFLVWQYSGHYHKPENFNTLLKVVSNEVSHRALAVIGDDVLKEPLQSYGKLKDALKVCAAFRGTYLDYRDKADILNQSNIKENSDKINQTTNPDELFSTKSYGPYAYQPTYGLQKLSKEDDAEKHSSEDSLYMNSPWPQRNASCFVLLNSFMERCNDVLELVQTTQHFTLLSETALVGGAGNQSLDAFVRDIDARYKVATNHFFTCVTNVLNIDGTQAFEKAFFQFRSVVKNLEVQLADVINQSFSQCPTVGAQLRLLEVFEGISNRDIVQSNIKEKDKQLLQNFMEELLHVKTMFTYLCKSPPTHKNMPSVVSKIQWVHGLRTRIQKPMEKLKALATQLLEGDTGWEVRETYNECLSEFEKFERHVIKKWSEKMAPEMASKLKQPVFV